MTTVAGDTVLLQAVRSGSFDKVTVEVRDGAIARIVPEGDVDPTEVDDGVDGVHVKRAADVETFQVSRRDGGRLNEQRASRDQTGAKERT